MLSAIGFRFQKHIRIFNGLTLKLSKSGSSWTVGRLGVSVNIKDDKVTGNVGIPGTGLSYRQSLNRAGTPEGWATPRSGASALVRLTLVAVVVYVLAR